MPAETCGYLPIFLFLLFCVVLIAIALVFVGIGRGQQTNIETAKTQVLSLIGSGKWTSAEAATNKLIADFHAYNGLPETLYEIAEKYEIASRFEDANKCYEEILRSGPDGLWADRADLGIERVKVLSLIESKDFNQAGEVIEGLNADFNDHPDFAYTLYWLAERYERQSRFEEAKTVYQRAIRDYSDDPYADKSQMGLSRAEVKHLIMKQKYDKAKEELDKFIDDFNDNPDLAESLYWITERFKRFDKFEDAKRYYERIVEEFPDTPWADKAKFCIARADMMIHFMGEDYNAVSEAIDKLITDYNDNPDLPGVLYWLTERYERIGNFDEARHNYQRISDNYPESEFAGYSKLGISTIDVISEMTGDFNEVEAALENLVNDFNGSPRLAHSVFLIGEQYYNMANEEPDNAKRTDILWKAISVWDRIIKDLPPSGDQLADAHYWTGVCYQKMGDLNKTIEHFQASVDSWPEYIFGWSAYCLIGEYYEQLVDSNAVTREIAEPKIEQAYKAVIEKYPDSSLAGHSRIKLGWHYFRKQQLNEAAKYFEDFLNNPDPYDKRRAGKGEPDPREVGVLFGLGMTYQKMGDLESAKQTYRMFLEKAPPTDQHISRVKQWLEQLENGQNGSTSSPQADSTMLTAGRE